MAKNSRLNTRPIRLASAVTITGIVALVACTNAAGDPMTVSDWCWRHHRLAPPGALAVDAGPDSTADAAIWDTWLGSSADAPLDRHGAHHEQRRLIDRFIDSGGWNDGEREQYTATAGAEPTTATTCETVGARIAVDDDGTLPNDWNERFLDPNDPAFSRLAVTGSDR